MTTRLLSLFEASWEVREVNFLEDLELAEICGVPAIDGQMK